MIKAKAVVISAMKQPQKSFISGSEFPSFVSLIFVQVRLITDPPLAEGVSV